MKGMSLSEESASGVAGAITGHGRGFEKFAFAAIVGLALVFVILNRGQLPEAWRAARSAHPEYIALAAGLSVLYLLNIGAIYRAAYRALGLHISYREMLVIATAGHFLNMVVANSAGLGGLPLFLHEAKRWGHPRALVTAAYVLVMQLGHLVFAMVLVIALILAWADGEVTRTEWAASVVFAVYTTFSVAALVAAVTSRAATRFIHSLPRRARRNARRLIRRQLGPFEASHAEADELYDSIHLLVRSPSRLVLPAALGLLTEVLGIAMVWSLIRAFNAGASLVDAVIAYAMGVVFGIVGILPAGLGFAEAGMGIALTSAGVPGARATLIVVMYRTLEVWVPFAAGAWSAHVVLRRRDGE